MSRNDAMLPPPTLPDRDLALLSAYLDGELTDRERQALEIRLTREAALRAALDDLGRTVALLRNMPRLKAPRNFTLDPATFTRRDPWWRRLIALEAVLQLSGALGTAAAVIILALAILQNGGKAGGKPASEVAMVPLETQTAIAILNAMPTSLGPAIEEKQTEIAYAGGEQFDSTLAAQSDYIARMTASPVVIGLDTAAMAPTLAGTATIAAALEGAADEVPPAALPMEEAQAAGAAQGIATFSGLPDQTGTTAQSEAESVPGALAPEATFREPPTDSPAPAAAFAPSATLVPQFTATRTLPPTLAPTATATTTLSPSATLLPTAPADSAERDDAETRAGESENDDALRLAMAGAALLVLSVGLFAWGRWRARAR